MSSIELRKLRDLIMFAKPTRVLEIGMANGTSSIVMADALRRSSHGSLTSIDPNQTKPAPQGYGSAGLKAVSSLMPSHRLIEDFDHVVLPQLVDKGETFDFILVDGFHSFDLTFLDFFYADKLLQSGGLLVCHDSSSPAVQRCCDGWNGINPTSGSRHRSILPLPRFSQNCEIVFLPDRNASGDKPNGICSWPTANRQNIKCRSTC